MNNTDQIRVAIVEDNSAYLNVMQQLIDVASDLTCVGGYVSVEESLGELENIKPDVLLLDLNLPGMSGMQSIPVYHERLPNTEILIITSKDEYREVLQAVDQGVMGYILKTSTPAQIRDAIRDVRRGGAVIDPKLSKAVLAIMSGKESVDDIPLSNREVQVLKLLANGLPKKQVADELGISYHTVVLHSRNIYEKLGVPNISAAIATAIRERMI